MPIVASDWALLTPYAGVAATLPAAATIAPTSFLTVLTGNVAIVTIVPPVQHAHMLALQFAGTAGLTKFSGPTGNIGATVASVADMTMLLVYSPAVGRYLPVG